MTLTVRTLASAQEGGGGGDLGSLVTSSFTPAADELVLVLIGMHQSNGSTDPSADITCANSQVLPQAHIVAEGDPASWSIGCSAWWMISAGAAMTVTGDFATRQSNGCYLHVVGVSGDYDPTTPIGVTGVRVMTGADGAQAITLSANTQAGSYIFGCRVVGLVGTGSVAATPAAGHSELYDQAVVDNAGMQSQFRNDGAVTDQFEWSDIRAAQTADPGDGTAGIAFEVFDLDPPPPPNHPVIATTGGEIGTSLGSANAQTLPSGSTTGDLVLEWATNDNPGVTDLTAPAGWHRLFHHVAGSNIVKHACWARILDGTGDDTLTISGAAQDYCVSSARIAAAEHGVSDVTTDIEVGTPAAATSGNANPPSLDAGVSADWLWLASCGVDFTTGNTISADPGTYTLVDNRTSASSTSSCGQRVSSLALTTQTEDPGTFTNTSQEWVAGTIAIPPPGGTDGTATPGVIAATVTLPAVTTAAGSTLSPAVIARSVAMPASTASASESRTPATITAPATLPAVTTAAGAVPTPAAIAATVTLPIPDTGVAGTANPAVVAAPVTMLAPTTAAGSVPTPAAIAATATLPAAATAAGATTSPASITVPVTLPAVTTAAGARPTPVVIPVTMTMPAASASGSDAGTASPATITATVALPAAAPQAGSTVSPAATTVTVTMPAAVASGSAATTPAIIPLTVTTPAASATGSGLASPTAIAVVTTMPTVTNVYGSTVTPATIALAVTIWAAIAQGLLPDPHPLTLTIRAGDHMVTVRGAENTATVRSTATATVRER